jgi:soluble lytic murein transglycosylase-like protein
MKMLLRLKLAVAIANLLVTTATAQTLARTNDPFASENRSLGAAADRLLAAPAQRREETAVASDETQNGSLWNASAPQSMQSRNSSLSRLEAMKPVLDPILRKEGVPTELAAVMLVESGGRPMALSPKGARGLWQLMPETARRYGLVVSDAKDERVDPEKATWAATQYLRDLYEMFGDWRLALAAYNAGEEAVSRAIARIGSREFSVLSLKHALPDETRKYVPAVMAEMGWISNAGLPGVSNQAGGLKKSSPVYAFMELGD